MTSQCKSCQLWLELVKVAWPACSWLPRPHPLHLCGELQGARLWFVLLLSPPNLQASLVWAPPTTSGEARTLCLLTPTQDPWIPVHTSVSLTPLSELQLASVLVIVVNNRFSKHPESIVNVGWKAEWFSTLMLTGFGCSVASLFHTFIYSFKWMRPLISRCSFLPFSS